MNLEQVKFELERLKSASHKEFLEKLVPDSRTILGIKTKSLRDLAKRIYDNDYPEFLDTNDFAYYELMILQALVIGYIKDDIDLALRYFNQFVPHINDWAVCDTLCSSFVIAKKEQQKVWDFIITYQHLRQPFIVRTLVVMLLCHYLNDQYIDEVLKILDSIQLDNYYTKMGIAWALATVMIKYRDKCFYYLKHSTLDKWTYNKAIQKMLESYRIDDKDKAILRTMKK